MNNNMYLILLLGVAGTLFGFKYFYNKIFIEGFYKISIGEYQIRRIKYNFDEKTISELREIALNSVNIIPNNPFFQGKNLNNKIALIIYHKNKPIGFNVMFDYKYKNLSCLHIGLVLIDKNYRGKKIQTYSKYNTLFYLLENFFNNIYISDLSRSASGLKLFNHFVRNSYPNLTYKTKKLTIYKEIFDYFFNNFKSDTQISGQAVGNNDNFIIYNCNYSDGANYLLEFKESTMSKDEKYNEFIKNNLKISDTIFSVGKINTIDLLFRLFF